MAKSRELPDFNKKRKLLFGPKTTPEQLEETARLFMEAGRYDEALEFLQRADADDLTRRIADVATEAGNAPLFMRAMRVLGEEASETDWLRVAANAEKAELWSAAYLAYRQAGREEEAAAAHRKLPGFELAEPVEEAVALPEGGD